MHLIFENVHSLKHHAELDSGHRNSFPVEFLFALMIENYFQEMHVENLIVFVEMIYRRVSVFGGLKR